MSDTTSNEQIVCRTTRWYLKRMGLMFLLVAGMGGWFLYDGLVTYPKKIAIYSEYEVFQEREEAYEKFRGEGRLAEWNAFAASKGWPEGEPTPWRDYSKEKGWPLKPDKRVPGDEIEQIYWAGGMAVLALGILGTFLLNRNRVLSADGDSFTTPSGTRIPFNAIHKIDKRKWKHKGLAYAFYKDPGGAAGKAVIDDLKYDGAERVLDRALANFEGELIDRIEDQPQDTDTPADSGADPAPHAEAPTPADQREKS